MRGVAIAAVLLLLPACALPVRASTPPLELCRRAFPEYGESSDAAGWVFVPVLLPLAWIFGPERVLGWLGLGAVPLARRDYKRKLRLLHRAADQGHLPSRYLLAKLTTDIHRNWGAELQLEGLLTANQVGGTYLELASLGFPPGELAAAEQAADAGFGRHLISAGREDDRYYEAHYRASQRWQFFGPATRAGLRGSRPAWAALADRYAELIDQFESSAEDRSEGYAWTYLASLPVDDFDRRPDETARRENLRSEAWDRLRDEAERERARELADRYEAEVFPHRIRADSEHEICALEPQFAGAEGVPFAIPPTPRPQPIWNPPRRPRRPPQPAPL